MKALMMVQGEDCTSALWNWDKPKITAQSAKRKLCNSKRVAATTVRVVRHVKSKSCGVRSDLGEPQLLHTALHTARGALQWLWGNSAPQQWLTASAWLLQLDKRRCETNAKEERCFTLTGIRQQQLPIYRSSSKRKPGKEKGNKEWISPDEACHGWSLRSACYVYSTSGRTYPGAECRWQVSSS